MDIQFFCLQIFGTLSPFVPGQTYTTLPRLLLRSITTPQN